MSYHDKVGALAQDAEQMEQVYHAALKAGETDALKEAIDDSYRSAPENLLYAAWFHRLKHAAAQAKGYVVAWAWVIPLAVINGLLFWWLSADRFMITIEGFRGTERDFLPAVLILAASLSDGPGAVPGAIPHADGYASAPAGLGGRGGLSGRQAS